MDRVDKGTGAAGGAGPARRSRAAATKAQPLPQKAHHALAQALGVPPLSAAKIAMLGVRRRFDLVLHLPLRYEDETRITPLDEAAPGDTVQVEVQVLEATMAYRPRRQLVVRCRDASHDDAHAPLVLRFVHFYGSQAKHFEVGARIRALGELREGFFGPEMIHPRYKVVVPGAALASALTPVYPTTAGLTQTVLRKAITAALASEDLSDTLPQHILEEAHLVSFSSALTVAHSPRPEDDASALLDGSHPAWQRIKFDELLTQQLSLKRAHAARYTRRAPLLRAPASATLTQALLSQLPFQLTGAQTRVWQEIAADLSQAHPMQRLLQGDVGSGKTIVAALAACRAVEAGYQAAFMAPTEILAEQHYRKLTGWLRPLGVEIAWLTGSLKAAERRAMSAAIAGGQAQIAVGTHALFQNDVAFHKLGLAVVDEQHRFGVKQRLALRSKGFAAPTSETQAQSGSSEAAWMPHQLMMSATPIPRTLAMTFFADLDVSLINELPAGRSPILTKLISAARRAEVIERVRHAVAQGTQAYWVCPLIEESEQLQLQTAVDTHAALQAALPELRVGLVHGRLKNEEKAAVMREFASGAVHLLVATTVIEVGVDVPNAALMVIEHAERFGLAQLHQLRGRVGRGQAQSVCVLLYEGPLGATARARLKVMYESVDGFEIARQDLKIRGPGEFLGAKQSGVPMLRFANLEEDIELVEHARNVATQLLQSSPEIVDAHLARWLAGREEWLRA